MGALLSRIVTGGIMVIHAVSGHYIAAVLAVGVLTWPQAARLVLTILMNVIVAYEFVYRGGRMIGSNASSDRALQQVIAFSLIPFCLGMGSVLLLFLW